jgi:hypothetical protein
MPDGISQSYQAVGQLVINSTQPSIANIQSHSQRQITAGTFLRIRIRGGNFSWMSISVEPLIEHLQDGFSTNMRVSESSRDCAAVSVTYQIIVCYNCKTREGRPNAIKHMLGS